MTRPRSADDFYAIRARMEELRRERAQLPVEEASRSMIEPPLYADSGGRTPAGRPGVPGWRVTPRKHPSSS